MSAKPISAEAPIMRLCDEPFVDFLGFREETLNGETRYFMDFRDSHIGNPMIRTFHGGILASFGEVTAAAHLARQRGDDEVPLCSTMTLITCGRLLREPCRQYPISCGPVGALPPYPFSYDLKASWFASAGSFFLLAAMKTRTRHDQPHCRSTGQGLCGQGIFSGDAFYGSNYTEYHRQPLGEMRHG